MMRQRFAISLISITWICAFGLIPSTRAAEGHRIALQGNDRLAIVEPDGTVSWEMPWGGIHDIHVLANGHIMVQKDMREIVEIDPATKQIVWSYNAAVSNGNAGRRIEIHAFQPLDDGHLMIAESGAGRMIEIDREGNILKQFPFKINHPHPHTDTRLARKLNNEHYLVCHEADGTVREYDSEGQVVWDYEVPLFGKERRDGHGPEAFGNKTFAAVRLANGETLLTTGNGHSILRVTPEKEIVWQLHQRDLPGITLAWVTTIELLPNGNYLIGNCHAGPGQPVLIELEPQSKKLVWQFDGYELFGNNVSNATAIQ